MGGTDMSEAHRTEEQDAPIRWAELTMEQRVERWENVLRVLTALPPHEREKHWDMSQWGSKTACGTVACAAGHCGLDPWFRERGFRLDFRQSRFDQNIWIESLGTTTVQDFFGQRGTEEIFLDSSPRSVEEVIEEVTGFIDELKAGNREDDTWEEDEGDDYDY